jgi:hypothetical protein
MIDHMQRIKDGVFGTKQVHHGDPDGDPDGDPQKLL